MPRADAGNIDERIWRIGHHQNNRVGCGADDAVAVRSTMMMLRALPRIMAASAHARCTASA
jgi:hypothetical protein